METVKNTVTIDVEDYNDLRDFRKTILDEGVVISGNYSYGTYFYTREEGLKKIVQITKIQEEEISKLEKEISELKEELKKQNRSWPFR